MHCRFPVLPVFLELRPDILGERLVHLGAAQTHARTGPSACATAPLLARPLAHGPGRASAIVCSPSRGPAREMCLGENGIRPPSPLFFFL